MTYVIIYDKINKFIVLEENISTLAYCLHICKGMQSITIKLASKSVKVYSYPYIDHIGMYVYLSTLTCVHIRQQVATKTPIVI